MRPHRWQLIRLPCPWDSPGKNTGVGCHFLLQCLKVKSESEVAQLCPTLSDPVDCSLPGSSVHGIFQARVLEWLPFPSPKVYSAAAAAVPSVVSDSVQPHRQPPTRLPRPWDSPGTTTVQILRNRWQFWSPQGINKGLPVHILSYNVNSSVETLEVLLRARCLPVTTFKGPAPIPQMLGDEMVIPV